MADIINLRHFKKQKSRVAHEKKAEENRILFGRTKAEKDLDRLQAKKSERFLDQGRLERKEDESDNR